MTSENAAARPGQSRETTSENTDGLAAADLAVVAAVLRDATANLDAHIAARANEIAALRIAAAEAAAERERQRAAGLEAECRCQLDSALERLARVAGERDRLAWLVRYLPAPLRTLAAAGSTTDAWICRRPDGEFVDAVDVVAARCGLVPDPLARCISRSPRGACAPPGLRLAPLPVRRGAA